MNNIFYLQVLAARTAGSNDHLKLELPRIGHPECNSKPSPSCSESPSYIQLEGHRFTWIKSRGTPHVIEERLDRAMTDLVHRTKYTHSFKFENLWLKEEDVGEVVETGWANIAEANHLMSLLDTYSAASGQEINLSKSEVFFSRNLSKAAQEDFSGIMGVKHVMDTCTNLGLPSMVGRSRKATFGCIKDKIWKKINSWRGRSLSKA
ncbi:putative non-LTR retroelement reverse transcriptase, partial [Trifolium medium]|nr:putative non-LTR retroelement reverse transcriptase [Trifolium medium]